MKRYIHTYDVYISSVVINEIEIYCHLKGIISSHVLRYVLVLTLSQTNGNTWETSITILTLCILIGIYIPFFFLQRSNNIRLLFFLTHTVTILPQGSFSFSFNTLAVSPGHPARLFIYITYTKIHPYKHAFISDK